MPPCPPLPLLTGVVTTSPPPVFGPLLLPLSSKQDHFRQVVKPCFTDVYRERGEAVGVAEFETMEDMRTAIRRLDDTEFKNPFEKSYIRIIEVCVWLHAYASARQLSRASSCCGGCAGKTLAASQGASCWHSSSTVCFMLGGVHVVYPSGGGASRL